MRRSLKAYIAAVIMAAATFVLLLDWGQLSELEVKHYFGLAVFVLLASLTQHMAVDSGSGRQVRSSISFLPLLALIVIFPTPAVVLGLVVMWVVNELRPGRNAVRLSFNLSQTILAYGFAGKVFTLFSGKNPGVGLGDDVESFLSLFFPFYGGAATFFAINILLVSGYLAIRDGQRLRSVIAEATGRGGGNFFYDLLASPIALLAGYLYWKLHVAGLLAVVFPLLLIRYSYLSALQLERANRDLLRVLIKAIETRDPYTSGHSLRVSTLARMIAEDFGLGGRALNDVETAALLHDIGKIDALYAEIISKEASLTTEEMAVIRTHATKGADLLQSLTSLDRDVIVGVRHHHERYDGDGYPDGLAGKSIPLSARIIMICDAVDAMLSDRPYRKALPVSEVRNELNRCAGTQFDPDIVESILQHNTLERAELLADRSGARARIRVVAG
jgi:putative nucleotidyltransferase with HDIG domain